MVGLLCLMSGSEIAERCIAVMPLHWIIAPVYSVGE